MAIIIVKPCDIFSVPLDLASFNAASFIVAKTNFILIQPAFDCQPLLGSAAHYSQDAHISQLLVDWFRGDYHMQRKLPSHMNKYGTETNIS